MLSVKAAIFPVHSEHSERYALCGRALTEGSFLHVQMLGQWFPDSGAQWNISFHIFATHQTGKNVTRQYFNNLTARNVCKSSRSYV